MAQRLFHIGYEDLVLPIVATDLGVGPASGSFLTYNAVTGLMEWTAAVPGSGTVTTISVVTANGLSGTVANPTTTPALTLAFTRTLTIDGVAQDLSVDRSWSVLPVLAARLAMRF